MLNFGYDSKKKMGKSLYKNDKRKKNSLILYHKFIFFFCLKYFWSLIMSLNRLITRTNLSTQKSYMSRWKKVILGTFFGLFLGNIHGKYFSDR